jgi:beta-galactosidase
MAARVPIGMCPKTGLVPTAAIRLQYGDDLKKQLLVGEYGAWRSLICIPKVHLIKTARKAKTAMTQLMETKVRLAEAGKR